MSNPHQDGRSGGQVVLSMTAGLGEPGRGDERSYLLCFAGDRSSIFELPAAGEVIVGRAADAQLCLQDAAVSRHHARLLVVGQEVEIADLDSRHGTQVNGARVRDPRALLSGDVIVIGGATLVFHRAARVDPSRPLLAPALLRQRLDEELERAQRYQRQVALLVVVLHASRPASRPAGQLASRPDVHGVDRAGIAAALAGQLRLIDAAGFLDDQGQLALIVPEVDQDEVEAAVERIIAALTPVAPALRVGVAVAPGDGCDTDTLLGNARAAADACEAGAWAVAADAARRIELGQQVILIADPGMHRVYGLIERLARSELPILIGGATGTGKEMAALAIHHFSPRAHGPLVTVNCAALPDTLAESELFGHERGAFTGAQAARPGLLEQAQGGTVFLDELGELSLAVQAKLLRAIETQRIRRLGDVRERAVDVRIVAATNRDLEAEIAAGRFREDLFFRLGAARIVLPPLRDRPRELAILARAQLAAACARMQRQPLALSPAAMQRLYAHDWPGNVRELKNAMDFAAAAALPEDEAVEPWHLPEDVARLPGGQSGGPAERQAGDGVEAQAPSAGFDEAGGQAPEQVAGQAAEQPGGGAAQRFRPIADEVRELERMRMVQALAAAGGRQTQAAALIAMPLRTFVTKLKRYGIQGGRG